MPTPVTISQTPLFFDALPAVKVRHYYGDWPQGGIYTFARMYICAGALHVSLSAFEKEPDADSLVGFGVSSAGGSSLFAALSPCALALTLQRGELSEPLTPPQPQYFRTQDEQGYSWGAQFAFSPQVLAMANVKCTKDSLFFAGVYKYRRGQNAWGAAEIPRDPAQPFAPCNWGTFQAVPY